MYKPPKTIRKSPKPIWKPIKSILEISTYWVRTYEYAVQTNFKTN